MDVTKLIDIVKIVGIVIVLFIVCLLVGKGYNSIKDKGRAEVQALWDADKAAHLAQIQKIKVEMGDLEKTHREKQREVSDELSFANEGHLRAIAALQSDFASRLRSSENRAEIYRRQAQGGTSEQGDLASHAARLDASLEEGRFVVGQLKQVVEQRDREISALSKQILADRSLLEELPDAD